ncbi:MAG TPA: RtcB family protein [Acidimicrobiales bacterium]|nr:RtcB family protein [Acidimicrobiales bacterium]
MTPTKLGKVLNWASDLDDKALAQAKRTAELPFVTGHVALMPDAHYGLGATIGSVIPTEGAVIPAAVGVDIGCGMIAAELPFTADALPDTLDPLLGEIATAVPAGGHPDRASEGDVGRTIGWPEKVDLTPKQRKKAINQFGTLGSGNHFVEVCLDERDHVWVVLHSGSRGIGHQLAKVHIEGAKRDMKKFFIDLPDPDLAYLVEGTPDFEAYIDAMLWAQRYALANRELMMDAVLARLWAAVGREGTEVQRINCHHNFTEKEHHHGRNVWLTRKGAIRAREGDLGVIPGSMGAASYIVEGLGNPASYTSCSHGAGRRMSRGEARRTLDVETLRSEMGDRAWLEGHAVQLLDEDPRAYKDIDQVMEDQQDLVRVRHRLRQVLNYKGL